jgi:hypothetical protein
MMLTAAFRSPLLPWDLPYHGIIFGAFGARRETDSFKKNPTEFQFAGAAHGRAIRRSKMLPGAGEMISVRSRPGYIRGPLLH